MVALNCSDISLWKLLRLLLIGAQFGQIWGYGGSYSRGIAAQRGGGEAIYQGPSNFGQQQDPNYSPANNNFAQPSNSVPRHLPAQVPPKSFIPNFNPGNGQNVPPAPIQPNPNYKSHPSPQNKEVKPLNTPDTMSNPGANRGLPAIQQAPSPMGTFLKPRARCECYIATLAGSDSGNESNSWLADKSADNRQLMDLLLPFGMSRSLTTDRTDTTCREIESQCIQHCKIQQESCLTHGLRSVVPGQSPQISYGSYACKTISKENTRRQAAVFYTINAMYCKDEGFISHLTDMYCCLDVKHPFLQGENLRLFSPGCEEKFNTSQVATEAMTDATTFSPTQSASTSTTISTSQGSSGSTQASKKSLIVTTSSSITLSDNRETTISTPVSPVTVANNRDAVNNSTLPLSSNVTSSPATGNTSAADADSAASTTLALITNSTAQLEADPTTVATTNATDNSTEISTATGDSADNATVTNDTLTSTSTPASAQAKTTDTVTAKANDTSNDTVNATNVDSNSTGDIAASTTDAFNATISSNASNTNETSADTTGAENITTPSSVNTNATNVTVASLISLNVNSSNSGIAVSLNISQSQSQPAPATGGFDVVGPRPSPPSNSTAVPTKATTKEDTTQSRVDTSSTISSSAANPEADAAAEGPATNDTS